MNSEELIGTICDVLARFVDSGLAASNDVIGEIVDSDDLKRFWSRAEDQSQRQIPEAFRLADATPESVAEGLVGSYVPD